MSDKWKKDLDLMIHASADNLASDIAEVVDKFLDEAGHPNKPGHDSGELKSTIFNLACANLITASDEIKRLRSCESEPVAPLHITQPDPETIADIVKWLRKRHGEHLRMQSIIGGSAFGDGRRDECGIIANLLESGDWRKEIEQ